MRKCIKYLCETEKIYFRTDLWYRFVVDDSCPDCVRLAKHYGYEPVDLSTWQGEGGAIGGREGT